MGEVLAQDIKLYLVSYVRQFIITEVISYPTLHINNISVSRFNSGFGFDVKVWPNRFL